MKLAIDPRVDKVISSYPTHAQKALNKLRELILEVAQETSTVKTLEETLKWGEPSYLTKFGSTIRIDWKAKSPEQYAMYFKCTSQLVPTFKSIYGDIFTYENNRAILFSFNNAIPKKELKHCIHLALNYHKIKHLPLLGA